METRELATEAVTKLLCRIRQRHPDLIPAALARHRERKRQEAEATR